MLNLFLQKQKKKKEVVARTPDHHYTNFAMYRSHFNRWINHSRIAMEMPQCDNRTIKPVYIGVNDKHKVEEFEKQFCLKTFRKIENTKEEEPSQATEKNLRKSKHEDILQDSATVARKSTNIEDDEAKLIEIHTWKCCLWNTKSGWVTCDYKQVKKGVIYFVFETMWNYDTNLQNDELQNLLKDEPDKVVEYINNNMELIEALHDIKPKCVFKNKLIYDKINWPEYI